MPPTRIYRDADIVAAVTDAAAPVLDGDRLEPGTHVINIGAGGAPDRRTIERCDVYLRFGDAPAPRGHPELGLSDEYLSYTAPAAMAVLANEAEGARERGAWRACAGEARKPGGHRSPDAIRGGLPPARSPIRSAAICRARSSGQSHRWSTKRPANAELGRELPTEWFLQDIRN